MRYFEHGLLAPESTWFLNQGFAGEPKSIDENGRVAVLDGPELDVNIDWEFVERRRTGRHRLSR